MKIGDNLDYLILPSEEIKKILSAEKIFRISQKSILSSESENKDNHQTCGSVTNSILKRAISSTTQEISGMMAMTLLFKDITGSERRKEEISFDQGNIMIVDNASKFSFSGEKSSANLFKKLDMTRTISKQKKIVNGDLVDGVFNDNFGSWLD